MTGLRGLFKRKESDCERNENLRSSKKYYSQQDLVSGHWSDQLSRASSQSSLNSSASSIGGLSSFSFSSTGLSGRRKTDNDIQSPDQFCRQYSSPPPVLNTNFTRNSRTRVSRRDSTKKREENRLSGMSFDEPPIPEDHNDEAEVFLSSQIPPPRPAILPCYINVPPAVAVNRSQKKTSIPVKSASTKGVSREWHKEYPETYETIRHDKKEVTRQNIILEICNSHSDFYEDLIHVKKVYVRGLELFGKLDSHTIESLFGNLNEVIQVNDGLEDELKLLRDDRGIINHIGEALKSWVPRLSCYAEYAKGLVLKRKRLEDCFNEDKVQKFLQTAESAKFARKLTIWSFLDAPRSNLPRLKLQLERLHKNTPEGNADLKLLPVVIEKLDEQIKKLNDSIAAAEFQSIVSTLTNKHNTGSETVVPFGANQLIFKGNVKFKNKDCELLLFDTCCAVSRQKGRSEREIVKCEHLSTANLEQPNRNEARLSMTREGGQKTLIISAQNPTDAATWVDEFQKAKSRFTSNKCDQAKNEFPSISSTSSSYDMEEVIKMSDVPKRLRENPKTDRPASWFSKVWAQKKAEIESPKQPRRKTIDVADKNSTDAIDAALAASENVTNSMVNLPTRLELPVESASQLDFDPTDDTLSLQESTDSKSVARSGSSVSGTSFASSDSDGFMNNSHIQSRRTAIYQKPRGDGCEDEPIDGPVALPISEQTLIPPSAKVIAFAVPELEPLRNPPALPPRPSRKMLPVVLVEPVPTSKPVETVRPCPISASIAPMIEEQCEDCSERSIHSPDEIHDSENEHHMEEKVVDRVHNLDLMDPVSLLQGGQVDSQDENDSDSFENPDSFDSGHPKSPVRQNDEDIDADYFKSIDNEIPSPRSLALSEMGSEVDVDQSQNLTAFNLNHPDYRDITTVAKTIVAESISHAKILVSSTPDCTDEMVPDSGTDSFSEQMEDELDALACSIVGRAIGLVQTELSLPPIP